MDGAVAGSWSHSALGRLRQLCGIEECVVRLDAVIADAKRKVGTLAIARSSAVLAQTEHTEEGREQKGGSFSTL